jgi:DNA repair exonuclease SbcCD nuclease subunit
MKMLLTSDWHADAKTLGRSRFGDVDRAVRQTVDAAIERRVDCWCFLGDLCDPDSGSAAFRSVELAVSTAMELSRAGIINIWVAGNHDVIEDGSGDTTLSPLRPLYMEGSFTKLFERPGHHMLAPGYPEGVTVHALPYTATSHPYSPAGEFDGVDLRRGRHVVLAHLMVRGVEPGEETNEMPRGRDVVFPRDLFPTDMSCVQLANGHYHRQQVHEVSGRRPVLIPGAAARFTFGEGQNLPGYMIVEV